MNLFFLWSLLFDAFVSKDPIATPCCRLFFFIFCNLQHAAYYQHDVISVRRVAEAHAIVCPNEPLRTRNCRRGEGSCSFWASVQCVSSPFFPSFEIGFMISYPKNYFIYFHIARSIKKARGREVKLEQLVELESG